METTADKNFFRDTKAKNFAALQVALQTMKERCIYLQRRNSELENQRIRQEVEIINDKLSNDFVEGEYVENLQKRVKELTLQNTRLTEQINMVSDENRRVWSRLSQMSKKSDVDVMSNNVDSQNLIRSKTFTQHSPNSHLRQKMISSKPNDTSLEEIVLVNEDVEKPFSSSSLDEDEMEYPYVQVENVKIVSDSEFNADARRCMDGLQELRHEAMKQQELLTILESKKMVLQSGCPQCSLKMEMGKPEMADKGLGTDDSIIELKNSSNCSQTLPKQSEPNGHKGSSTLFNILQEKTNSDAIDRTCPMCGKNYTRIVSFKAFQEHVEMHFLDDSLEQEGSMDRNFEFISHAVGEF